MPAVRPSFHLTPCSKFRSHLCCGIPEAHNRNYITYIGNKLQLVRKGDDNTSLHSPLAADETLYMRQPVR